MRFQQILEKYLPVISEMLAPAIFFAVILFTFLCLGEFAYSTAKIFHGFFYFFAVLGIIVMLNFNIAKMLFFNLTIVLAYIIINYLKNRYGPEFNTTSWYNYLAILTPCNLLGFYLCYPRKFISRQTLMFVMILSLQCAVIEKIALFDINIIMINNINIISQTAFAVLLLTSFVKSVKSGNIYDYSILYASLATWLGFCNSSVASGLSVFFFTAQSILISSLIYSLVYSHFYDDSTGFYNRNSYLIRSKNFPLKYSLGIVSIDNYDKIGLSFGKQKQAVITSLMAEQIHEIASGETIFRYAPDQFIILYKTFDKKEAFAHLDEIRRTIARNSFAFSPKQKAIKLTVSCSVAEKKRSDAGAVEVLMRADKAMRKTLKFSHNVTSQG